MREAVALRRVQHPNVVRFREAWLGQLWGCTVRHVTKIVKDGPLMFSILINESQAVSGTLYLSSRITQASSWKK